MTRPLLLTLVVLTMLGIQSAHAATLPADTTAILSGASSLFDPLPAPVADSEAGFQSVSGTGTKVAFASRSDGLSSEDNDSVENIYVKDLVTGAVTLVSRASGPAGAPATADCGDPAISDNGNRVAFDCRGALDPDDSGANFDVYVRDLTTSETFLVSRAPGAHGAVGTDNSIRPSVSADGTKVAFGSRAKNLTGAPFVGGPSHVFVRDLTTNQTQQVDLTPGAGGSSGNAEGEKPSISNDGDLVAFQSNSSNLVAGDTNARNDAFVRKLSTGANELLSRKDGAAGILGNGDSFDPQISGNGTAVTFDSSASNLLGADLPDHDSHIYRRTVGGGTTSLIDQAGGTRSNTGAIEPEIDDSGNVIVFVSGATNLDPAATNGDSNTYVSVNGGDAMAYNRADGPAGALLGLGNRPASVSGDGTKLLFSTQTVLPGGGAVAVNSLALRDRTANTTTLVSRPAAGGPFLDDGGSTFDASVSADGRYTALVTTAPGLLPPGVQAGVVVRDAVTGTSVLASRADGPNGAPLDGFSFTASISADGQTVAFDQFTSTGAQVFVRDLSTGSTTLASRADGASGDAADGFSAFPTISADGNRVEFLSAATDLSDADPNSDTDAYVRDLSSQLTFLASRADGPDGVSADEDVEDATLSGDGRHIAFSTSAKNLGDGDTDPTLDIHVRDLSSGTTKLASVSSAGEKGNGDSEDPSIDADGGLVAFDSSANNLGNGVNGGQVWVHDLGSGQTTLASRVDGPAGDPSSSISERPVISAEGRIVAFESNANDLIPGIQLPDDEVYRRDLATGATRLVSRGLGPAGLPARDGGTLAGVTADGACVAFLAQDSLVNPGPGAADFPNAYMRAFTADCGRPPLPVPPGVHDATAPVLRSVTLSRTRFRVAKGTTVIAAAKKKKTRKIGRGTTLRFASSEAASLSLRIERLLPGRKTGKGRRRVCKPVRHRVRRGRCTVFRRTATLTRGIKAGPGRVALTGRIGRRRMAPGRYRLTLTARDAAGNSSKAIRRNFTIVPG